MKDEVGNEEILRALGEIKDLLAIFVGIYIKAEGEIPEDLRRQTMYYHDLYELKLAAEEVGSQLHPTIVGELNRVHERLLEVIDRETTQGGNLHHQITRLKREGKIRRP